MRTIRAIEHCDVCIVMVDATVGFDAQDLNIFHLAEKNHKGIVVLVNKWDLVENKETMTLEHYRKMIYAKTAPFTDYPILLKNEKKNKYKVLLPYLTRKAKLCIKI